MFFFLSVMDGNDGMMLQTFATKFLDNANLLCKFSKVDNNVNQLSLAEVFENAILV